MIPYGILANSLAIILGGIFGTVVGKVLPKRVVTMLPSVLGLSAMGIGIMNVVKGAHVSTIILTLLLGAVLGELLSLEQRAKQAVRSIRFIKNEDDREVFLTLVVLFSLSGTGIFGALHAGVADDHSILYAKAVLDFFTAFSFAVSLGFAISTIAAAQCAVQLLFYGAAILFFSAISQVTIANFQAVGGLITFAIGLKLVHNTPINILNLTPALLLALFFG